MSAHIQPRPVKSPFWTPGVFVMVAFMAAAAPFILARYIKGLGFVTNLDNIYPWGLWIGIDVASGVALAAGGFTTAALAHIFGRHHYEAVTRPALLTAMLGYTFVAVGLFVDIGRSWAIWKPAVFWQPNSVLFEVAMCVMIYLTVLYIEFFPIAAEKFRGKFSLVDSLDRLLGKIMWIFIILGVVLSCMHQSGLGSLMLIAPTKLHPLWYTPILPLLFLTSAISLGYPMVVVETIIATTSLKLDREMDILGPLTRITLLLLGIYGGLKIGDMLVRGTYVYLWDGSAQSFAFMAELGLGVITPWLMLWFPKVRRTPGLLFTASAMVVGGVLLNRINVFIVGYQPPFAQNSYYPAIGEILVTVGLVCTIMFLYRLAVTFFPVLSARRKEA